MIDDMASIRAGARERRRHYSAEHEKLANADEVAIAILPYLRGKVATTRRSIGHYNASDDVIEFVNSNYAPELAALGTSCPDHFIRTRIAPLYVEWDPKKSIGAEASDLLWSGALSRTYTDYYNRTRKPFSCLSRGDPRLC